MPTEFQVDRHNLRTRRFVDTPEANALPLVEGEAVLHVDAFAFTANNVTYGAMGDAMNYWKFFPAPGEWGRIPAWGFGTVVRSDIPGVVEGTRYYGYYPMSTYVRMKPERVASTTFTDGVENRTALHPLYNQYTLAARADALSDALYMLLRPLFITSFILDDFFEDNAYFGARRILVTSASSKTAYGMAFLIADRIRAAGWPIEIVGLTSPGNVAFVETLGSYKQVVAYDALDTLPATEPAIFVDFAANAKLRQDLHALLGDKLKYSSAIGLTHWDQSRPTDPDATPLAGPAPVTFFAPAHIKKRIGEWGAAGFNERFDAAWQRFTDAIRANGASWLSVTHGTGSSDLERVYDDALSGTLRPDEGHVLSLP